MGIEHFEPARERAGPGMTPGQPPENLVDHFALPVANPQTACAGPTAEALQPHRQSIVMAFEHPVYLFSKRCDVTRAELGPMTGQHVIEQNIDENPAISTPWRFQANDEFTHVRIRVAE